MADLYKYNEDSGIVIPQTSEIKAIVQNKYLEAFGNDLSLVDSTPQGVLIQNETDSKCAIIEANANVINGFNIFKAKGVMLDAIGLTFGVARRAEQGTIVRAVVSGIPNTIINQGSVAQTINGDNFTSLFSVQIGDTGIAEVDFVSETKDAVACPAGSLTTIISETNGWESITNLSDGVLGYKKEGDSSYRSRIFTESQKASGFVESFKSELTGVENLKDSYVDENYENIPVIKRGIEIPPHSVVVIARGGSNEDVAKACYDAKDAGAGYTSITSTYAYGYITFDRNFIDGDTITIGTQTITAGVDFTIGANLESSLQSIITQTSFSSVTLEKDASMAKSLYITAKTAGVSGNSITLSSTNGICSDTTLSGGMTEDLSVTETVYNEYGIPNSVIFNRPLERGVAIRAVIETNFYAGSDLKSDVENAIMSWANNEIEDVEGLNIGVDVNAWEIASAITIKVPSCRIKSVFLGDSTGEQARGSITFADNLSELDTITIGNTELVAGKDFAIGETLNETLLNILSLEINNNILSLNGSTLNITYKYVGTDGNSEVLATSATGATVVAMSGGTNNPIPNLLKLSAGTVILRTVAIANMEIIIE